MRLKDYEIFISRCGITNKVKSLGYFFPANGEWDLEDFDIALDMCRAATIYFTEHRTRLKIVTKKIHDEIKELTENDKEKKDD